MGWVDGVNKNSGDVISAALWTSYLGAGDGIDAMETAKVTTAASGQASGLSWAAAPGATNAANNECVSFFPNNAYRTNALRTSVANRIYVQVLDAPTQAYTFSEFLAGDIPAGTGAAKNYLLSIYSFDNSTLTRRATSGSTAIPSGSAGLTKLPLSFQVTVGVRYAMAYSNSGTQTHYAGTNDTDNTNFTDQKGSCGYNDPGSFTHPSTIAWSAITSDYAVSGPIGVWANGGIFT